MLTHYQASWFFCLLRLQSRPSTCIFPYLKFQSHLGPLEANEFWTSPCNIPVKQLLPVHIHNGKMLTHTVFTVEIKNSEVHSSTEKQHRYSYCRILIKVYFMLTHTKDMQIFVRNSSIQAKDWNEGSELFKW